MQKLNQYYKEPGSGDNSPARAGINQDLGAIMTAKPPIPNHHKQNIVLTAQQVSQKESHMKVLSLASIPKQEAHVPKSSGKAEKQLMSQLLKKNKIRLREDQISRQQEQIANNDSEDYTPLENGLTMKSMTVVHKIRKQNRQNEEQRNQRVMKL